MVVVAILPPVVAAESQCRGPRTDPVRDSRDGDYRILQAVTENPVRRVELAYVLIGPVADLAQALVREG